MYEKKIVSASLICTAIFFAAFGAGMVAVSKDPFLGEVLMGVAKDQVFDAIVGDEPFTMFIRIFLNNLGASFLIFLGGASLGIVTFLVLAANGLFAGAIIEVVRSEQGLAYVAAAVLPHGLLEIPAFLFAGALGFLLAEALLQEWQGTGDAAARGMELGRLFVCTVIPILALAAFIESFITPVVVYVVV